MKWYIFLIVSLLIFSIGTIGYVSASPYFSPQHIFPTAKQSQNACYFNSVNIAIEAKFGTKLHIKRVLDLIWFDGKTLATWEYKKRFSDLTHITLREFSKKQDLITLLDRWEPVLVSTEIVLRSWKKVRHVSVAYSYERDGIWVSDPLGWKRKRIAWHTVFSQNGYVRYYNLRTIVIKPYLKWNMNSKEREKKEDIWDMESEID
jgi:hypothetical protein